MNTPIFSTLRRAVGIRPPTTGSARRWLQRMGGMVLFFFLLFLLLGRVVGVPRAWKESLVRELSSRGLEVDARKITLDPLGGLVARDLVVYRDTARKEERLRVGRVELSLNWLAWKKGEPFLSGARLRDAHMDWPLGEGVEAIWSARKRPLHVLQSIMGSVKVASWPLAFQTDRLMRIAPSMPTISSRTWVMVRHQWSLRLRFSSAPKGP